MTREDVIEILARFVIGAKPCSQREIIDACASAYGMLKEQPSIPSNIDEVAQKVEDYYDVGEEHGYLCCYRGDIKNAFKAGAEWMAGQFQKIEGELVDWYSSPEGKDYCCGVKTIDSFEVPEGFYIRKK